MVRRGSAKPLFLVQIQILPLVHGLIKGTVKFTSRKKMFSNRSQTFFSIYVSNLSLYIIMEWRINMPQVRKMIRNQSNELHPFWKILRVTLIFFTGLFILAFLANRTPIPGLSKYVLHPAMFLASVICTCVLEKKRLSYIGLVPILGNMKRFFSGFIVFFLNSCIIAFFTYLLGYWNLPKDFLHTLASPVIWQGLFYWLVVVLGEEVLFRGYLISVFENKWIGIFWSSLIFSAVHLLNPEYTLGAFVVAFIVGLLLGYISMITGNLWMGMGCHLANNWFQGTIFQLPYAGEYMVAGVMLLNIIIFYRLNKRKRRRLLIGDSSHERA